MTDHPPLLPGDIVQLDPSTTGNRAFAACLLVVTAVRDWGIQGYVQALGDSRDAPGGQAYYRAVWGTFEPTGGRAIWEPGPEDEDPEEPSP